MSGARFIVRGRVQGVGFRASTRHRALQLGLSGSARNLADGSVQVDAVGNDESLSALERWLWQGPPTARVSDLERAALPTTATFAGFETG